MPAGFPWCLVGIGDAEPDQDDPGLLQQQFRLIVAVESAGDPLGEHAVIGGPAANLGRSAGRGVAEVVSRALDSVRSLTAMDGAKIQVGHVQTAAPAILGRGRHLAMQEVSLSALCTSELHYSAPQHLRHQNGQWRWSGEHCSGRFDFYRYRLVRKAGTDPSATPADGTVLYTGTSAFWTGSQVSGQTYTVFADYNARGVASVEGSSSPEVGAWRTP